MSERSVLNGKVKPGGTQMVKGPNADGPAKKGTVSIKGEDLRSGKK